MRDAVSPRGDRRAPGRRRARETSGHAFLPRPTSVGSNADSMDLAQANPRSLIEGRNYQVVNVDVTVDLRELRASGRTPEAMREAARRALLGVGAGVQSRSRERPTKAWDGSGLATGVARARRPWPWWTPIREPSRLSGPWSGGGTSALSRGPWRGPGAAVNALASRAFRLEQFADFLAYERGLSEGTVSAYHAGSCAGSWPISCVCPRGRVTSHAVGHRPNCETTSIHLKERGRARAHLDSARAVLAARLLGVPA